MRILLALLLSGWTVFAANPTFNSFNTRDFTTNSYQVSLKNWAMKGTNVIDVEAGTNIHILTNLSGLLRTISVVPDPAWLVDVTAGTNVVITTNGNYRVINVASGGAGVNGTNGVDGSTGPVGPQGPAGVNGTNGIDGSIGPQGPAGTNGTNGVDGSAGPAGPQGVQGLPGLPGANGANGTNGLDGTNALATLAGVTNALGYLPAMNGATVGLSSNVLWSADAQEPTGFIAGGPIGAFSATQSGSAISLSWSCSPAAKMYMNGALTNIASVAVTVPTNRALYFVCWTNGQAWGSEPQVSTNVWSLQDVQLCTVFADSTNVPIVMSETHGTMQWSTHRRIHLDAALAAAYIDGFTYANVGRGVSFAAGRFFDEDLLHNIPSTTNLIFSYRDGTSGWMTYTGQKNYGMLTNTATGSLQYDSNGTLTDAGASAYMNVWYYALPNANTNLSIIAVLGRTSGSSTTANNELPPALLPGFASAEAILIARGMWRNTSPIAFSLWTDYRASKVTGSGSITSGATGSGDPAAVTVVNGVVTAVSTSTGGTIQGTNVLGASSTAGLVLTSTGTGNAGWSNVLATASFADFQITPSGTNVVISPTNGNLQSLFLSGTALGISMDAANTNFSETVRLNIYGSNSIAWSTGTLSNAFNLNPTGAVSVLLFDHVRNTNLWWGFRLR